MSYATRSSGCVEGIRLGGYSTGAQHFRPASAALPRGSFLRWQRSFLQRNHFMCHPAHPYSWAYSRQVPASLVRYQSHGCFGSQSSRRECSAYSRGANTGQMVKEIFRKQTNNNLDMNRVMSSIYERAPATVNIIQYSLTET